jgi:hypothetical protein
MTRLGTYAPAASTGRPASEKQISWIRSMIEERHAGQVRIIRAVVGDGDASEALAAADATRDAALARLDSLTTRTASKEIDTLKDNLDGIRSTLRTMTYSAPVEPPVSAKVEELIDEALYVIDGYTIVRIRRSGAGRQYAMTLNTDTRRWEYAKGLIGQIRPAMRMTPEQAKAFGDTYSWCSRCGRDLTREDSVTRGMGPVCYGKSVG